MAGVSYDHAHAPAEDAAHGGEHGADGGGHGADEHGGEALGPFDLSMWGAAGLGVVLGLLVAVAFAQGLS